MSPRFTLDGSEALEQRLEGLCQEITREVRALIPADKLDALILAGGYGRGEGGALKTPEGDAPYNDLEFYVFLRGSALLNERKYNHALHELGEALTEKAGFEVEFKIISVQKLKRSAVTMFYYDLVSAHRLLHGAEGVLKDCEHHRAAHRIPLFEATRLLMNRCSGLLYSKELIERPVFSAEDADFVGRNLAKPKLALGDVILTAYGQYHFSCRERHRRLEKLAQTEETAWVSRFVQPHLEGVDFKLHPVRSKAAQGELAREHKAVSALAQELWLWLERRRLGRPFPTVESYALSPEDKCPETDPVRNMLVTARAFGVSAALSSGASRYPRERLLNTLPLLLWCERPFERVDLAGRIAEQLRTPARDLPSAIKAYRKIWNRFN